MNWLTRFVRVPFMRAMQEIPWLGPVISTVLVAMTISLLYDWLKATGGLPAATAVIVILAGITVLVVYTYAIVVSRHRREMATRVIDKPNPPQFKGLILMVSGALPIAKEAIEYHDETLQCCWLITTPAPKIKQHADQLKEQYDDAIPYITIVPIENEYDTKGCYELVRNIYQHEAHRLGLESGEVIADITGGTKPMTMGMILACLEGEFPIEHVPTEYDKVTFKPKGPLLPIQITVDVPPWASDVSGE
ncbi:MAG: hypothetical protein ACE5I2_08315 [Anaerolineae bacterium]